MINLPAIMVSAGLCVGLMMVLIYSNSRNIRMAFYDDRLYYRLCYLTLGLSVLDMIANIIDGKMFAGSIGFSIIINVALFLGNFYFQIVWYQYILYKLTGRMLKPTLRDMLPIAFPLIGMVLASFNLFVPVLFKISNVNIYQRLPLSGYTFLASHVFLIYTAVFVYRKAKSRGRYFFLPVVVFIVPIFLGSFIQYFFYGISLIYITEAFGLTSLYINLQNESSLLDSLTKLYNREFLTRYIKSFSQKTDSVYLLGGIMIDINSFKEINDRYGHEEGDKALINLARILKSATTDKDLVSRYGGDEFVILRPIEKPRDLEPLQQNIITELKKFNIKHTAPYELSISIGLGVMDPMIDSPDDFMRLIDSRMYRDKEDYYRHMAITSFY